MALEHDHAIALSISHHITDNLLARLPSLRLRSHLTSPRIPKTSSQRLQALSTQDSHSHTEVGIGRNTGEKPETYLYLAYGSNLAAETFLGRRGIKPLSQVNVVAPSIQLSFDLPGIAYSEPCFGNCRYKPSADGVLAENKEAELKPADYHKNAWKKGLVGVVYEVTASDYAHIIATEGGGAGYHDVMVECFTLDDDPAKAVPMLPSGSSFKAHTLFSHSAAPLRPDPDYAQPSVRYLKLITDGAAEHSLPLEYRDFLENIRTYHVTTVQQQLGAFVFLTFWTPVIGIFFGTGRIFLRPDGTYPRWFARLMHALFTGCWASYDKFFKPLFGDGERSVGDAENTGAGPRSTVLSCEDEKAPLLPLFHPTRLAG